MNALGPAYATQYIERFGFPQGQPAAQSVARARHRSGFAAGDGRARTRSSRTAASASSRTTSIASSARTARSSTKRSRASRARSACAAQRDGGDGSSGTTASSDAPIRAPSNDEMRWGGLTYLQEQRLAPPVISPQNDFLMTDMMSDVIRRGTATRALQLKRSDLAGKTGTTNDRPRRLVLRLQRRAGRAPPGSASTRNARSGRGEEGGRTALPMWIYFMAEALQGRAGAAPAGAAGTGVDAHLRRHRARRAAGRTERHLRDFHGRAPARRSRSSTARSARTQDRLGRSRRQDDDSLF